MNELNVGRSAGDRSVDEEWFLRELAHDCCPEDPEHERLAPTRAGASVPAQRAGDGGQRR